MMWTGLILVLYDSYIQQQAIAKCSQQKGSKLSSKELLEFATNLEGTHRISQNLKDSSTSVNAISSYKTSQKEKKMQKQDKELYCWNCKEKGHMKAQCQKPSKRHGDMYC